MTLNLNFSVLKYYSHLSNYVCLIIIHIFYAVSETFSKMARTKQTARHASARSAVAAKVPRHIAMARAPASNQRSYRFSPGTRPLTEIRKWQRRTDLILPNCRSRAWCARWPRSLWRSCVSRPMRSKRCAANAKRIWSVYLKILTYLRYTRNARQLGRRTSYLRGAFEVSVISGS